MKKQIIIAAMFAGTMFAGSALAMDVNNSFTNMEMMSPFYTDDTMSTTRSEAEVKEILSKMNPEARQTLKDDCMDPMQYRQQSHGGICDVLNTM